MRVQAPGSDDQPSWPLLPRLPACVTDVRTRMCRQNATSGVSSLTEHVRAALNIPHAGSIRPNGQESVAGDDQSHAHLAALVISLIQGCRWGGSSGTLQVINGTEYVAARIDKHTASAQGIARRT